MERVPELSNCYLDPHSPLRCSKNTLKPANSVASGLMRASGLQLHSHSAWSERCQACNLHQWRLIYPIDAPVLFNSAARLLPP